VKAAKVQLYVWRVCQFHGNSTVIERPICQATLRLKVGSKHFDFAASSSLSTGRYASVMSKGTQEHPPESLRETFHNPTLLNLLLLRTPRLSKFAFQVRRARTLLQFVAQSLNHALQAIYFRRTAFSSIFNSLARACACEKINEYLPVVSTLVKVAHTRFPGLIQDAPRNAAGSIHPIDPFWQLPHVQSAFTQQFQEPLVRLWARFDALPTRHLRQPPSP
jgi:hypothetical protein